MSIALGHGAKAVAVPDFGWKYFDNILLLRGVQLSYWTEISCGIAKFLQMLIFCQKLNLKYFFWGI